MVGDLAIGSDFDALNRTDGEKHFFIEGTAGYSHFAQFVYPKYLHKVLSTVLANSLVTPSLPSLAYPDVVKGDSS